MEVGGVGVDGQSISKRVLNSLRMAPIDILKIN